VLGGRAMQIIRDDGPDSYLLGTVPELVPEDIKARYPNDKTGQINTLLGTNPLLFDSYLTNAIEVDVDCLCDGKDVNVCGIMEHIEEAGIHSGDSACSLPVHTLARDGRPARDPDRGAGARALNVGGLMNVQYAIKDGVIYVLEVNPRASRTVPFVAKTVGSPIAKIAARVMAGETSPMLSAYGPCPTTASSTTSRSRKRSSRLPSSPASTRCSGRKCAPPAR
jgi:carbamoyl-phosphate synthase large subunit